MALDTAGTALRFRRQHSELPYFRFVVPNLRGTQLEDLQGLRKGTQLEDLRLAGIQEDDLYACARACTYSSEIPDSLFLDEDLLSGSEWDRDTENSLEWSDSDTSAMSENPSDAIRDRIISMFRNDDAVGKLFATAMSSMPSQEFQYLLAMLVEGLGINLKSTTNPPASVMAVSNFVLSQATEIARATWIQLCQSGDFINEGRAHQKLLIDESNEALLNRYLVRYSAGSIPPSAEPLVGVGVSACEEDKVESDERADINASILQSIDEVEAYIRRSPAFGAFIEALEKVVSAAHLHAAAEQGDERTIMALLESGTSAEITDVCGRTPLHRAAAVGHLASVQRLLKHGAKGGYLSVSPLQLAVTHGHLEVAELLLSSAGESSISTILDNATALAFEIANQSSDEASEEDVEGMSVLRSLTFALDISKRFLLVRTLDHRDPGLNVLFDAGQDTLIRPTFTICRWEVPKVLDWKDGGAENIAPDVGARLRNNVVIGSSVHGPRYEAMTCQQYIWRYWGARGNCCLELVVRALSETSFCDRKRFFVWSDTIR